MKKYSILLFLFTTFIFTACDDNGGNEPEPPEVSSVYTINEGNFSQSNGTISSFNPETNQSTTDAFNSINSRPFAGFIQSSTVIDERLYIVSNMANKIEVVDLETLNSVGTVELSRDATFIVGAGEGQAYVANLFENNLTVIDLENLTETDETISVGTQPRDMINVNGRVYVSNNGGLQTSNVGNTISVVDTESNSVVNAIEVADKPGKMVTDANNQIWLICTGLTAYDTDFNRVPEEDTPGALMRIDADVEAVTESLTLDQRPVDFVLNERDSRLYLLDDNIDIYNMLTFSMEEDGLVDRSFSAIDYSASEQIIYAGQSRGLDQNGQAIRYTLDGAAVDSFEVGVSPIEFIFATDD